MSDYENRIYDEQMSNTMPYLNSNVSLSFFGGFMGTSLFIVKSEKILGNFLAGLCFSMGIYAFLESIRYQDEVKILRGRYMQQKTKTN